MGWWQIVCVPFFHNSDITRAVIFSNLCYMQAVRAVIVSPGTDAGDVAMLGRANKGWEHCVPVVVRQMKQNRC